MDLLTLYLIIGSVIIIFLFTYELRDPNKLNKTAETHNSPQSERILFYTAALANIVLQCYFLILHIGSVYCQNATSHITCNSTLFLLGLSVCIVGSCLRQISKHQLGTHFTYQLGVTDGQILVTDGLYSRIKHPSYLGLCMLFLGTSIAFQSLILVTTFVQMVLAALIRIAKEEELLEDRFGEEYDIYSETRWRMLPYVY